MFSSAFIAQAFSGDRKCCCCIPADTKTTKTLNITAFVLTILAVTGMIVALFLSFSGIISLPKSVSYGFLGATAACFLDTAFFSTFAFWLTDF